MLKHVTYLFDENTYKVHIIILGCQFKDIILHLSESKHTKFKLHI